MTTALYTKDDLQFCVSDSFESRFLLSLVENLKEKLLNDTWDDYNEIYHCCRIIHEFSRTPGLTMDFHTLRRGESLLGMVIITHGSIAPDIYAQHGLHISDPIHEVALLNYFHIAPEGRGNGTFWIRDIVMPLYADLGYTAFYLKTSHPKVFPLYDRLGAVIGHYTQSSDNMIHQRKGRLYRLPLYAKPLPKE